MRARHIIRKEDAVAYARLIKNFVGSLFGERAEIAPIVGGKRSGNLKKKTVHLSRRISFSTWLRYYIILKRCTIRIADSSSKLVRFQNQRSANHLRRPTTATKDGNDILDESTETLKSSVYILRFKSRSLGTEYSRHDGVSTEAKQLDGVDCRGHGHFVHGSFHISGNHFHNHR